MKEKLIAAHIASAAVGAKLFAVEVPDVSPGLGSLIGNLGVVGTLIWYLYYHTKVAQPRQLDKFTEEQKSLREASAKEQEALRNAFASEQKELRATFVAEQASQRASFAAELEKMRAHTANESGELRAILAQVLAGFRTAVHDTKDTANQAILKTELASQRAIEGAKPKQSPG